MLQSIASYIWGYEEETEQTTEFIPPDDQIEIDNEWIYIPKDGSKNKNSNLKIDKNELKIDEKPTENTRVCWRGTSP